MTKRFVLEGEWTGYRSSQARISHREVISETRAKDFVLSSIIFTDGTSLLISVRPAKPRENVDTISQYAELIRDAEKLRKPIVTVAELRHIPA